MYCVVSSLVSGCWINSLIISLSLAILLKNDATVIVSIKLMTIMIRYENFLIGCGDIRFGKLK